MITHDIIINYLNDQRLVLLNQESKVVAKAPQTWLQKEKVKDI